MRRIVALGFVVIVGLLGIQMIEAHPGNVRRSDCTHRVSATGERHRHTGRPYCSQVTSWTFMSDAWMHH